MYSLAAIGMLLDDTLIDAAILLDLKYEIFADDPILEGFSERQQLILIQRQPFLAKPPNTLKQIARDLRISRQRVFQIEHKATAEFAAKALTNKV